MPLASRCSVLVLVLGVCGLARDAAACLDLGEACADVNTWTTVESLAGGELPVDGMIVMRVSGPADTPAPLDVITIEVTLAGAPVAGALEQTGIDGLIAWRPAAPLVADSTYVVAGTIHNLDFQPGLPSCGEEFEPFEFEVAAGSGGMPPLSPPEVGAELSVEFGEKLALDNLVCCDGAFPYAGFSCGGGGSVQFEEGHCTPVHWTGMLTAKVFGQAAGGGGASMVTASLVIGEEVVSEVFVADGSFQFTTGVPAPFCSVVVLRNLVTGETVSAPEQCHGDALADQLGSQTLTPDSPALAECAGEPYVCELDEFGEMWDPDRCAPWPAGEGTTGEPGGPTSGGPTSGPGDPGGETTGGTTEASTGAATSPGNEGLVEHGCACDGGGSTWGAAGLGLLLLAGRRRRREMS